MIGKPVSFPIGPIFVNHALFEFACVKNAFVDRTRELYVVLRGACG